MSLRGLYNESSMSGVLPSSDEFGGSNQSATKLHYALKVERKTARRNNEKKMIRDFLKETSEEI
jgi:hypothetical protein